jgi:hypothetical protein
MLAFSVIAACARPPRVTAAPTAAPQVPIAAPAPPPSADVPPADILAADVPAAQSDPVAAARESLLRALADGRVALAAHTDPTRGVSVIEYVEAGPGPGSPAVRRARHLCASAVAADPALRALLRDALSQADSLGITCEADLCTVHGMEYAPEWRVRFEGERITALHRLSEAVVGDAFLRARDAYVRRATDEHRRARCGAPR